jgi:nucleotide-binding universal stress UspA family protein
MSRGQALKNRVETWAMAVDPKTITVFLDGSPSGRRRAGHAATLSRRWNAHLVGVYVVDKGVSLHPSAAYARSEKAMAGVIAHERRIGDACEGAAAEVGEHFAALCERSDVSSELRLIKGGKGAEAAVINSLHSDLLVIGHPEPSGLPDDLSAERILLASGVPLLIVPNDWAGETIGDQIVIGWNASPEARRAVSDAMCFLVGARAATALIVDPDGCKLLGKDFGCDIGQHLARHGAHVELDHVASKGRPIAEVILAKAMQSGADLLVVGSRNPAHLREILFGNATRTLLAKMPVPVLVSR